MLRGAPGNYFQWLLMTLVLGRNSFNVAVQTLPWSPTRRTDLCVDQWLIPCVVLSVIDLRTYTQHLLQLIFDRFSNFTPSPTGPASTFDQILVFYHCK
ncbi:hypothetical protein OG21DRAFT_625694 [Imleria badia]|nr:hypothetical protein OG21DRAFT_625694 [Imleria badia]